MKSVSIVWFFCLNERWSPAHRVGVSGSVIIYVVVFPAPELKWCTSKVTLVTRKCVCVCAFCLRCVNERRRGVRANTSALISCNMYGVCTTMSGCGCGCVCVCSVQVSSLAVLLLLRLFWTFSNYSGNAIQPCTFGCAARLLRWQRAPKATLKGHVRANQSDSQPVKQAGEDETTQH